MGKGGVPGINDGLLFSAFHCIRIKRKVGIGVLRNPWEEMELL